MVCPGGSSEGFACDATAARVPLVEEAVEKMVGLNAKRNIITAIDMTESILILALFDILSVRTLEAWLLFTDSEYRQSLLLLQILNSLNATFDCTSN